MSTATMLEGSSQVADAAGAEDQEHDEEYKEDL